MDADYLATFSKQLEKDLTNIEKTAYEAAGETFNLGVSQTAQRTIF